MQIRITKMDGGAAICSGCGIPVEAFYVLAFLHPHIQVSFAYCDTCLHAVGKGLREAFSDLGEKEDAKALKRHEEGGNVAPNIGPV